MRNNHLIRCKDRKRILKTRWCSWSSGRLQKPARCPGRTWIFNKYNSAPKASADSLICSLFMLDRLILALYVTHRHSSVLTPMGNCSKVRLWHRLTQMTDERTYIHTTYTLCQNITQTELYDSSEVIFLSDGANITLFKHSGNKIQLILGGLLVKPSGTECKNTGFKE